MITAATISEIQQVQKSTPRKKNGVNYFTDELYPYRMEITAFTKPTKIVVKKYSYTQEKGSGWKIEVRPEIPK